MARVYSPNADFSGYRLGETFLRGVAEVDDPSKVETFRRRGWRVEGGEQPQAAGRPNRASSKAAWVDYAEQHGFDRAEAESMSKDDLIEALSAGDH